MTIPEHTSPMPRYNVVRAIALLPKNRQYGGLTHVVIRGVLQHAIFDDTIDHFRNQRMGTADGDDKALGFGRLRPEMDDANPADTDVAPRHVEGRTGDGRKIQALRHRLAAHVTVYAEIRRLETGAEVVELAANRRRDRGRIGGVNQL